MSDSTLTGRLLRYVRDGPQAGGNSVRRRMLGAFLHWETWAGMVLFFAVYLLHWHAGQFLDFPFEAGFIGGVVASTLFNRLFDGGDA